MHLAHSENVSLALYLAQLTPLLEQPDVTEFCINRPGEAWIERYAGWERVDLPFATARWCEAFASLLGDTTKAATSHTPIMSTMICNYYRVQVVMPPVTEHVSLTIRRPANVVKRIKELEAEGLFDDCRVTIEPCRGEVDKVDNSIAELLRERKFSAFFALAVPAKKNIVASGRTGSGKTTFTQGLILEIPADARLVTIEDARELDLSMHPNHVSKVYAKDGCGATPKQLLESCLRMRPDWLLLAEVRSDEAYQYLRSISAHPGITSVHASSVALAFEQLMLLVKESSAGKGLSRDDINALLRMIVDVVVQFGMEKQRRYVKEIYFCPRGIERKDDVPAIQRSHRQHDRPHCVGVVPDH